VAHTPPYIVLHHSASALSTTAADIDAWHREKGWEAGGYAAVIERTGELILGRGLGRQLAHARGYNDSIGICVVGDNTTASQRWVWQQIEGIEKTLAVLTVFYPKAVVLGHRDLPGAATLCPGLDVRELLGLSPLAIT
jgi:N-acetylmuramoyl-L-alanine amidase